MSTRSLFKDKKASCVIVAAGSGRRMKHKTPKLLIRISGIPIIIRSIKAFNIHPLIGEIILVVPSYEFDKFNRLIKRYKLSKVKRVVAGGRTRKDSVLRGLSGVSKDFKYVVIHDGARPFVDKDMISRLLRKVSVNQAAVLGVPVSDTIKRVDKDSYIKETISRDDLYRIQTPQVFFVSSLRDAYKKHPKFKATDSAALIEKSGKRVSVIDGSVRNIKITTPEDLVLAKRLAGRR